MTRALVALNLGVYVLWHTVGRRPAGAAWLEANFLVSTGSVAAGRLWTPLTAEVSHIDLAHLLLNMIALWSFGSAVERTIGPRRLLHLYVAGAVVASAGYLAYAVVVGSPVPSLGASGAVNAVAVVFACMHPRARLYVNFIPMPAALAVVGFVVLDLIGALNPMGSTVAHAAHLGGALYGFLYWLVALRPRLRAVTWG